MSIVSRNIGLHVVSHRSQPGDPIRMKTLLEEDSAVHRAISNAEAGRIDGGLFSTRIIDVHKVQGECKNKENDPHTRSLHKKSHYHCSAHTRIAHALTWGSIP